MQRSNYGIEDIIYNPQGGYEYVEPPRTIVPIKHKPATGEDFFIELKEVFQAVLGGENLSQSDVFHFRQYISNDMIQYGLQILSKGQFQPSPSAPSLDGNTIRRQNEQSAPKVYANKSEELLDCIFNIAKQRGLKVITKTVEDGHISIKIVDAKNAEIISCYTKTDVYIEREKVKMNAGSSFAKKRRR